MACNCGKKNAKKPTGTKATEMKSKSQTFELKKADGTTQKFGSKLEALAERARRGGSITF